MQKCDNKLKKRQQLLLQHRRLLNRRAHALKCTCNTSLSQSPDAAPRPPAADTLVSEITRLVGDCQQPPL